MSASSVRPRRLVVFVPVLFLVACNEAPSAENGHGGETGLPAAGTGAAAGAGGSMSSAAGAGGGMTSGGGGLAEAGSSANGGGSPPASAGAGGVGGGGGSAGVEGEVRDPNILVDAHFSAAELGPYAREEVTADFGVEATWDNGLDDGRATIEEEEGNRFLRVTFPGGIYGPSEGGVQFEADLGGPHEELYFAYRVRFQQGFGFNMGGKLPGFAGGTRPTGCDPDEGGFSARNMWRGGGSIVQYVYWPDQPNTCGDDLYYEDGGDDVFFTPGSWQTIEHRVRMNTPGQNDGVLQCWVDGEQRLDLTARQWRKTDAFGIDSLFFSTFFGGGSQVWASPKEQWVDFDDLVVSKLPISH